MPISETLRQSPHFKVVVVASHWQSVGDFIIWGFEPLLAHEANIIPLAPSVQLIKNIKEKFVRIYVNCVKNAIFLKKKCKNISVPSVEHHPLLVAAIMPTHSVSLVESDQKT